MSIAKIFPKIEPLDPVALLAADESVKSHIAKLTRRVEELTASVDLLGEMHVFPDIMDRIEGWASKAHADARYQMSEEPGL